MMLLFIQLDCFRHGGIVSTNNGTIKSCYNKGGIRGFVVAGIANANGVNNTIENCYNNGIITGLLGAGIVSSSGGNIINCYNSGNIEGGVLAGIICSNTEEITIENCYNNAFLEVVEESVVEGTLPAGFIYTVEKNLNVINCGYDSTIATTGIVEIKEGATVTGEIQALETMPDKITILNTGLDEKVWEYDADGEVILNVFNE